MKTGFFEEFAGARSMTRLCMLIGCVGGVLVGGGVAAAWAVADVTPTAWLCMMPASLMIGGCVPYTLKKINKKADVILENPGVISEISTAINSGKDK